ncbi:MAG: DNA-binding protein Alba [Candidatus Aenigmatarchaeota archaeon]|nr:DNA-binding protein Alba [Candidatus Aenigmarchaeota archaeon]
MAEKKKAENTVKPGDNVIFVGKKPAMSYVLAVITQFTGGIKEVNVKARGKSISRAVDVAEIVKNKFLGDVKVKSIEIGTEERAVDGGNKVNVSTISIVLTKS